jgi:hypothetical protein
MSRLNGHHFGKNHPDAAGDPEGRGCQKEIDAAENPRSRRQCTAAEGDAR